MPLALRHVALALLLVTALACGRAAVEPQPPPSADTRQAIVEDIVYAERDDGPLRADLYRPRGGGPHPGVLVIHGGSWRRGSKWDMQTIAERLAAHGYVAVSIDYRLAPAHPFPAAFDDARDAVRWMRAQAPALELDPDRIGVFGYSAGGHLAELLGTADGAAALRPRAVVAGGAPSDLRQFAGSRAVRGFLGGGPEEVPAAYAAASPLLQVSPDDPPTFLYHGRYDWLVDISQSTALRDALHRAGVPVELHETPGGHFATFFFDDDSVTAALGFLDTWLRPTAQPHV